MPCRRSFSKKVFRAALGFALVFRAASWRERFGAIKTMYAVIFIAEIKQLDASYHKRTERMRELAQTKYGCREIFSMSEGDKEVAVSYWDSQEQIAAWKNDPEHRVAQEIGRKKWYRSYQVQVVEIMRAYQSKP